MKALAIIDAQNDFINGNLGVGLNKWNPAKNEILKLINSGKYDVLIYTKDWHPKKPLFIYPKRRKMGSALYSNNKRC